MEFHVDCSMESIWTVPWNPYGIVHGFPLEIHWKFHGIHSGYGIEKWLAYQQKKILWNIAGSVKTSRW